MLKIIGLLSLLVGAPCWAKKAEMVPTEALLREHSKKESLAPGGGITSVGGSDALDSRWLTAWFYGERPIVACYSYAANFGVPRSRVERAIKSSISLWQKYFQEKKVQQSLNFKTPINLNFDFRGRCKGEEDLVFFMGTGPIFGNMSDLKAAQLYHRPLAYMNKTYMSRDYKWSKGYIRVVRKNQFVTQDESYPDWAEPKSLEKLILHEMGHILGILHKDKTIMRVDLTEQLFWGKSPIPLAIDHEDELVPCPDCEVKKASPPTPAGPVILSNFAREEGGDEAASHESVKTNHVSFMQETHPILCTVEAGDKSIQSLQLDAKDSELKIRLKDKELAYQQARFLDQAVLFKGATDWAVLQIQDDFSVLLIRGTLSSLREVQCEDTGASKTCKNENVPRLYWSPERLEHSPPGPGKTWKFDVIDYGFYSNDGTYFMAGEKVRTNKAARTLLLMDYGSPFDVLRGERSQLNCRYGN